MVAVQVASVLVLSCRHGLTVVLRHCFQKPEPVGNIQALADGWASDPKRRCGEKSHKHEQTIELEAQFIIVGYPISMDGTIGPRALAAEKLAEQVRAATDIEVQLFDERLKSAEAEDLLKEAGRSIKESKGMRDAAAAVLLTWWLEKNPQSLAMLTSDDEDADLR